MATNEQVLLAGHVEERKEDFGEGADPDKVFEYVAAELVMGDYGLSAQEAATGVIGGSDDAGVDGIFTLLNEQLLDEDSLYLGNDFKAKQLPTGSKLELVLIQAKNKTGFAETPIEKVATSTALFFDLDTTVDDLLQLYTREIVSKFEIFRKTLQKFAGRGLNLVITFAYVGRGDTENINNKIKIKSDLLESKFAQVLRGRTQGEVRFYGAAELWELASSAPTYQLQLTCDEYATSGQSYVALVSIRDYIYFISTDEGSLQRHVFDWNVRDYQGPSVTVNKEIARSANEENADYPDFWWLNNGVTVICSQATIASKTFILDDVQIVNGLQTSHTLHKTVSELSDDHPVWNRHVLVRVLITKDNVARDAVIRATNSQTSVPAASLRATDEIQRQIESYFLGHDWYYDRRKNYYRNLGKPVEFIIGIPWLAQAVMAMGLSRPHDSRARPSSLLNRDSDYGRIFDPGVQLSVYYSIARAQKKVDQFLSGDKAGVFGSERTNVKYQVAMLATAYIQERRIYSPSQLSEFNPDLLTDEVLERALACVRGALLFRTEDSGGSPDNVAKSSEFTEFLLSDVLPEMLNESLTAIDLAWLRLPPAAKTILLRVANSNDEHVRFDGKEYRSLLLENATRGFAEGKRQQSRLWEEVLRPLPGAQEPFMTLMLEGGEEGDTLAILWEEHATALLEHNEPRD